MSSNEPPVMHGRNTDPTWRRGKEEWNGNVKQKVQWFERIIGPKASDKIAPILGPRRHKRAGGKRRHSPAITQNSVQSSTAVLREVCDGNTRNAPSAIVRKEPIRQKSQERVHANVPQNDENENKDVDSNRVPEGYSKNGQYHTVRWESQPPATPPKKRFNTISGNNVRVLEEFEADEENFFNVAEVLVEKPQKVQRAVEVRTPKVAFREERRPKRRQDTLFRDKSILAGQIQKMREDLQNEIQQNRTVMENLQKMKDVAEADEQLQERRQRENELVDEEKKIELLEEALRGGHANSFTKEMEERLERLRFELEWEKKSREQKEEEIQTLRRRLEEDFAQFNTHIVELEEKVTEKDMMIISMLEEDHMSDAKKPSAIPPHVRSPSSSTGLTKESSHSPVRDHNESSFDIDPRLDFDEEIHQMVCVELQKEQDGIHSDNTAEYLTEDESSTSWIHCSLNNSSEKEKEKGHLRFDESATQDDDIITSFANDVEKSERQAENGGEDEYESEDEEYVLNDDDLVYRPPQEEEPGIYARSAEGLLENDEEKEEWEMENMTEYRYYEEVSSFCDEMDDGRGWREVIRRIEEKNEALFDCRMDEAQRRTEMAKALRRVKRREKKLKKLQEEMEDCNNAYNAAHLHRTKLFRQDENRLKREIEEIRRETAERRARIVELRSQLRASGRKIDFDQIEEEIERRRMQEGERKLSFKDDNVSTVYDNKYWPDSPILKKKKNSSLRRSLRRSMGGGRR